MSISSGESMRTRYASFLRSLAAAGAIALAASTGACGGGAAPTSADPAPVLPAEIATVAMTDRAGTFEAGGVVQARTTAVLTARILAPVIAVRAVPGDRVRSGQVLVLLDGRDLTAQARSFKAAADGAGQRATAATAEAKAAEAVLTLARATYGRLAALHAKRSATSQEFDEATAGLRAAEARVLAAESRVQDAASAVAAAVASRDAARVTESFTRIAAPFDGVVTEKTVEVGNMASPGTPLLRVEDTAAFRLELRVDESRARAVAVGAAVPVVVESAAGGDAMTLNGTVAEVARAVDTDTRTFLVKIALPGDAQLRAGMFGRARIPGPARRVLVVPTGAVRQRGQIASVFVVDGGFARLRLVNVAGTEVLAGLVEGERVLVNPPSEVVDGRRISEGGRQ